jgi:hypothetical protein
VSENTLPGFEQLRHDAYGSGPKCFFYYFIILASALLVLGVSIDQNPIMGITLDCDTGCRGKIRPAVRYTADFQEAP